jgi:protein SCO1/2
MITKQSIFSKLFSLISIVLILAACSSFHAKPIDPIEPAAEIELLDHNGRLFRLSDMHGKVVLLFFGFTNCVDECPLTMAHLKLALEELGDDAGSVQVVLVSTDPVRDTPSALAEFLGHFNPTFLGIPGDQEELAAIWDNYDIEVMDGGETHSSFTYAIDKAGNLRLKIASESSPDEIASDLRILLSESE